MAALSAAPLRGAAGVLAGWANRAVKGRGMATMVDTAIEAGDAGADVGMSLDPVHQPIPECAKCAADTGRHVLGRGLAIGLTAAVHAGRYRYNTQHLLAVLGEYLTHHNGHRPHQGRRQRPPDRDAVPAPVTNLDAVRVQRRKVAHGFITEYEQAA
ncbi:MULTISPECIES: hypothetical protein [unclassified Solwaraspora]|uniref:hypothetical protein n=1 Tax=unclassified Solwaraspora TaxID=2627926 RepID=UPI00248D2DC7|nr:MULTISPECIES: hypothetical protein [unclassified Solwaraspora]WBB97223.1 hypothetical protein O7553_28890 [Solwaraspora sp. WMMA2059]WBC18876.1 hypothetical protein O7543_18480 [Solwaraspora sp. WMMA2080]WJK33729.1 hypothetical protein O7610_24100 [Solwaraspora sp. WMMA2065]